MNVNEQRIILLFLWIYEVRCAHNSGDMVNFTTITCRISLRLKWYKKNYKNRSRLTKVIVKNKMSRFWWFTMYVSKTAFALDNIDTLVYVCVCAGQIKWKLKMVSGPVLYPVLFNYFNLLHCTGWTKWSSFLPILYAVNWVQLAIGVDIALLFCGSFELAVWQTGLCCIIVVMHCRFSQILLNTRPLG